LGGMVTVAYTDLPNGILILLACILSLPFCASAVGGFSGIQKILPPGHFEVFSQDMGAYPALKAFGYFLATLTLLMGIQSMYQKFYSAKTPKDARQAVIIWVLGTILVEVVVVLVAIFASARFWNQGKDPASMVLLAARYMVPAPVGFLLLAAACAVVISTGMNYLLSPSTNVIRDILQCEFGLVLNQKRAIRVQKYAVIVLGLCAFAMIFIPTILGKSISVLRYSYFAYTIYGVSITPALIAALAWKRATKAGGVASILSGVVSTLVFEILIPQLFPEVLKNGDPWGIPGIYPSLGLSILTLIVVSVCTKPPESSVLEKLFPQKRMSQ